MSEGDIRDSEGIYEPEDELDEHSKTSYLEHISYRLRLSKRLECEKGSGVLNTEELREMAREIIQFSRGVDVSNPNERAQFLNDLRLEMEGRSDFSFVTTKEWHKYTKTLLGRVIAATLKFQYDGDPHIGQNNGVVYLRFYEDVYDKLPDPAADSSGVAFDEDTVEHSRMSRNMGKKVKRFMTAPQLNALLGDQSSNGITVPEYQRSSQQWSGSKYRAMVNSMIHDIPMPSIVLGKTKERPDDPWQLVDGHQRLSTIRRFMDDEHPEHFDFQGFEYEDLPDFAKSRYDAYEFVVEWVESKNDYELAQLYTLYNSSGKPMSPVQIRVARWHEVSPLHHLLLAMAGGPVLTNRDTAKERLGILVSIDEASQRAASLRKLLPQRGAPTDDEKLQLRLVTEKTYDNYCKTMAYCLYRSEVGRTNETPTAEAAVSHIFGQVDRAGRADTIVKRLDYIIRAVATIYGDYAFLTHKSEEGLDANGNEYKVYNLGKALNGWSMQVQCGGLWDLSDNELSLLNHNPDEFQEAWYEFNISEMVDVRQNSKTLWRAQEKWGNRVDELLVEFKKREMNNEESPRRNELIGMANILRNMKGRDNREQFMDALGSAFNEVEVAFIIEESRR